MCTLSTFLLLIIFFSKIEKNSNVVTVILGLYPILECTLLSYFYFLILKNKNKKIVLSTATFLLCAAFLIDFVTDKERASYLPLAIQCFFYIMLILYFFYEKVKYITDVPIYSIASFWISIAFLINFSGTFFLFLFSISMNKDPGFKDQYHIIYGCFTILKNTLLCIGVIINKTSGGLSVVKTLEPNLDLESFYPQPKNTNL